MGPASYVQTTVRLLRASPGEVFAVLADPHRHPEIDGSGTVVQVRTSDEPLRVGSSFEMRMRRGFPYATRNEVVELETDRVVAWRTTPTTPPLSWLIGGRVWRYELEDGSEGTTVTATWDLRQERNRALVRPLAGDPAGDMQRTLCRVEELLLGGDGRIN